MKIIFTESRDNGYLEIYAISQLEVYKGKLHDELFWAEIARGQTDKHGKFRPGDVGDTYRVIWEDNFFHPVFFKGQVSMEKVLDDVKKYIIDNHLKHSPYINGGVYDVD